MLLSVPAQLGYPALGALVLGESAGLPLPGETALIAAGGLVAAGHLALPAVIAVAAAAAIIGDTAGYWAGRRGGRAFLLRDGWGAAHRRHAVERAERYFARYGSGTVFLGRWVPGVRVVAALSAGASRMPWRRFAVANAAGGAAWASTIATLAWLAGPTGALALAGWGLALGAVLVAARAIALRRSRGRRSPRRGHPGARSTRPGWPRSWRARGTAACATGASRAPESA